MPNGPSEQTFPCDDAEPTSGVRLHLCFYPATVGDSYDNARAETMIGLRKAEVIHGLGQWKSADALEWETLKWVDWFNNRRLLEPIGYITPTEAEEALYANMKTLDKVA